MSDSPRPTDASNPYAELPEPVRLKDTVESVDVEIHPSGWDDDSHEREWMLRHAAPQ